MDIYASRGVKVIFDNPTSGYTYDQNLAKKYLIVGNLYTVEKTIVHSSSTEVFLVEVPKVSFNSVLFSDTTKKKTFKKLIYEEVTKKFESIYWFDGEHVIDQSKWKEAEKEFEIFLRRNGWTRDSWLNEQCRRFLKNNK